MKAKIKVGGLDVEIEGTPSEIAQVLTALKTAPLDVPPVFVPSFQILDPCPMGGAHEYPTYWLSVSPPVCTKCNTPSPNWPLTTFVYDQTTNPMPPCRTTIVTKTTVVPSKELVEQLEGLPRPQGCTD